MPKKTHTLQPSFFHRPVPAMPDGYYSSGPNPNLARFVEEHATPYDPATDDYDVPPFDQPITTTKATAIYNMHTYWSKKPHDAIRQYIRHYTEPGGLVLDPFSGSGGTALAALMEGRAAIAIDLSPAATFITKNYCTPVDVEELQAAFEALQEQVKPEMDWLYATRCDRCDGRATTAYTVYSQVFQCPRCLTKIPLFDCIEIGGQTNAGKPKMINVCPYCHKHGHIEEIRSQSQKFGAIPVLVSYLCLEGCKPQRGERQYKDPDSKKRAFFEEYDLAKIREIEAKPIPHWYPQGFDMTGFSRYQRDALRLYGVKEAADLFTKRNLWALAAYKKAIDANSEVDLRSLLTWALLKCSKMMRFCGDGIGRITSGTYYIPQVARDSHVPSYIAEAFGDLKAHHLEKASALPSMPVLPVVISTQSACELSGLTSNSIDYVFTDPPYAEKIQYGELNFVWEAWLGFDTTWHDREIIVNETRGMTDADWARLIRQAMVECYRVLKPGRWISLCYHDTSEGTWQLVQDIMAEIGLIAETADSALYIDTSQKTMNQMFAGNVTKRDLVINFRKPRPGEVAPALAIIGDEDAATFAEKARAILIDALDRHPGASADRLYDELVSRMVRRGEFERHNFEALLAQVAEPVADVGAKHAVPRSIAADGSASKAETFSSSTSRGHASPLPETHESVRWYLRDTADRIDEAESAREAAAAARLEAFMRSTLPSPTVGRAPLRGGQARAGGEGEGIHYSDLFEQYLGIKDKPRRLLADWLPEYFIKTTNAAGAGAWRPPADDEERAQLTALRASGALRRIKRFANALLDGVQPAERDRPINLATAADWLRQCRRGGLYALGRAIYERGGFDFGALGEEAQVAVEEEYEVCVRRSG